jgi:hypothetical protein
MADLVSRNTKDIIITETNRPHAPTASTVAAAVNRLCTVVPASDVNLDENAGVATMSVPDDVDLADLQKVVGTDVIISLNQDKLRY